MKRNWDWRWIGRAFLCALVVCALLTTVAVAEDGDNPASVDAGIEDRDVLILDDGTMVYLDGGRAPLELTFPLSDTEPGIPAEPDTIDNAEACNSEAPRPADWFPTGYYKIVAANGRGEGDELYWDKDASWKDLKWKKEGDIWYMEYNSPIRYADDPSYVLNIEKLLPGVAVKCTRESELPHKTWESDYGFYINIGVFEEEGSKNFSKVTLQYATEWDQLWRRPNYQLKLRRVLSAGNDYVQVQKYSGEKSALWSLVPVNYSKSLGNSSPDVSVGNSGEVKIDWEKLRNKMKNLKVWKEARYVEVQCSTDKYFLMNVLTKKIKKENITKESAVTTLKRLKKNTKYYIRARLWDAHGVYSNWSKVVAVTIK